MKKQILLPGLLIGSLLTTSIALAGPFGGPARDCRGDGPGQLSAEQQAERLEQRLEKMSTLLDLSEAQQEQIETLLQQHREEHQQLREQLRAARDELHAARLAEPFNETDFRTKAAKHDQLKVEMMVDRQQLQQQIFALLSPEQQAKAKLLRGMLDGKRHHGGHRG